MSTAEAAKIEELNLEPSTCSQAVTGHSLAQTYMQECTVLQMFSKTHITGIIKRRGQHPLMGEYV